MAFMLQPAQQAGTYDSGYFYPGPVVANVPLTMAPAASRAVLAEFGRPIYDKWISDVPAAVPLTPDRLVLAFRRWDEQIGSKSGK
jgi:putative spermidine/putrescine transport system substrate-binding protein